MKTKHNFLIIVAANRPKFMRKLEMDELNRLTVDDFRETKKKPFVLLLDDVRSMNNVGSIFRTADAFLVEKIYLCGITGTPPHREIEKTALGATESVAWEYCQNILTKIQELRVENYKIIAVEQVENATQLTDFLPFGRHGQAVTNQKYAFIFGNEVFGVNEEVVKTADICLEIPQFGTKHSLNIAVSVGIICWEFVRQLTMDN
jgi:23S rRNA (guanosine2251-2'-O)-methyltransferase